MSARDSDVNLFVPLYDDDEASVKSSHLNNKEPAATDSVELFGLKLDWKSVQASSAEPNVVRDRDLDSEYGEDGMEHLFYKSNNDDETSSDIYDEFTYTQKEDPVSSAPSWNIFSRSSRLKPADVELESVTGVENKDSLSVRQDLGRASSKRTNKEHDDQSLNGDVYSSYSDFKDAFKSALETDTICSKFSQSDRRLFSNKDKSADITSFVEEKSKILGEDGFVVLGFEDPDDTLQPDGKWLDGSKDLNPTRVS
jgi:hypothetical protein